MHIQSITNYNPNFGLRMSQNAQVAIIEQYKSADAKDDEIIYYLKQLKTSQPDKFELQHVSFEEQVKNTEKGDKLKLLTEMWISDGKRSGKFIIPKTYDYEDNSKSSYAETKIFYFEHLNKAIEKAIAKLQHGSFPPSPIQKYGWIMKKSDFNKGF